MSATYTPDQLPHGSAQFIAYGAPVRVADPLGGADPLTVRPQTYVRYYTGIMIANVEHGGKDGDKDDLVTVNFDPASVGLAKPIKGHMDADDPTVALLDAAQKSGTPVAVAIETQRKARHKATKEPISPLTPIHALRGATNPDGSGDASTMMGPSGAQTTNRIVMVNGQTTKHIVSNAAEWSSLTTNKAGDLPPAGWLPYASGETWQEYGAAVPSDTPAPQATAGGSATVDPAAVQAALVGVLQGDGFKGLLHDIMMGVLDKRDERDNAAAAANPSGKSTNVRRFAAGKQWDVYTNDGRVNLGNYAVIDSGWCYRWAHKYLTDKATPADDSTPASIDPEDAWHLSDSVMVMADAVQVQAYEALVDGEGKYPVTTDRMRADHREAKQWVQWIIERDLPYPNRDTVEADENADESTYTTAVTAWQEQVIAAAVEHYVTVGRKFGQTVAEKAKAEREQRLARPSREQKEPEGPSVAVVNALLGGVMKAWDNSQALIGFGRQTVERGFSDLTVSMALDADGRPTLAFPATEGQPSGDLVTLLRSRVKTLMSSGSDGPAPRPPAVESAPQAPAPQAQEAAPQPPTTPQTDAQAPLHVGTVAQRLMACTSMGDLQSIYMAAKDANLLTASVYAKRNADGSFVLQPGQADGFQEMQFSAIMDALRAQFETPPAATTAPAPEEAADETPQVDVPETPPAAAAQATSEPPATPDAAPAAPDAPEGDAGTEDVSVAQQIANEVSADASKEQLEAFAKRAQEEGIYDETIDVDGRRGTLRSYLTSRLRRASKQAAS